jgi:membrane protease subunit HflK
MASNDGIPQFNGSGSSGASAVATRPGGRGRASVTLRGGSDQSQSLQDLMDPANKSLTDALKIAYRLLQAAIVCLILLYLASGFQVVQLNQRGLRLTFGGISGQNIAPGLTASWPSPIGDLLRVDMSEQAMEIRNAFFPSLTQDEEKTLKDPAKREQGLKGGMPNLDPDRDGQLLTADGSIVHTRWQVTYKRSEDGMSLRTIADKNPDEAETPETQIVTAAVRRGVVKAAASMTIDEVLYNQPDPSRPAGTFRAVADVAKIEAQRLLDEMKTGIQLQQVTITDKMPPRSIIENFNKVQSAQAEASQTVDEARGTARQILSETAGEAAPLVLTLIDRYEAELAKGNNAGAEQILAQLHEGMSGKPMTAGPDAPPTIVSGRVAQELAAAQQYRTSVVAEAQTQAVVYQSQLQAYRSNPQVFLASTWNNAMKTFMTHPSVQTMVLPSDVSKIVMTINKDPEIAKEREQQLLEEAGRKAREERQKAAARDRYEASKQTGQ